VKALGLKLWRAGPPMTEKPPHAAADEDAGTERQRSGSGRRRRVPGKRHESEPCFVGQVSLSCRLAYGHVDGLHADVPAKAERAMILRGFAQRNPRRYGAMLLGFVTLLPLMAFAGFAVLAAVDTHRAEDERRLRYTARALAAAVDAQIGSYIAALEALAASPFLDDPAEIATFDFRVRPASDRLGGTIFLVGPGPEFAVLATTGDRPRNPWSDEVRVRLVPMVDKVFGAGQPEISDLIEGPGTSRPVLAIAVPVDRAGQPRRALGLRFEPSALRALLAAQDLPDGTFAAVADGRFRILAHSFDPEGRRTGVEAPGWVSNGIGETPRGLIVGPGWSGSDNIYAFDRPMRARGWTVTVAEPRALQHASAWAVLRWTLAGGAAVGLGLALVAWATRHEALRDARREAEALRTGRAEVERLHGGLPALIFLREVGPGLSTRLIYRGGDIETVTGWPAATLAVTGSFQARVDLNEEGFRDLLARVLRDGTGSVEYRMRQPDGSQRPLRSVVRLLDRRTDGTSEIVGYVLDVSAERAAETRALATARLASLGEMAAGMAHEIRQPLQGISLAAEVAQIAAHNGDAGTVDQRLEDIVALTQRTSDLIERLRRFARGVEDGTPSEAVPLASVVGNVLTLMRNALRDISIQTEVLLGDPAPVVRGQAILLEQVLSNLLLNARDALAERTEDLPRWIRIAAVPGPDGMVCLSVADNGGGLPPEVMVRLFEPFVTTKGPDRGTGLGLSICHGLVKGMGGRIEARNEAGGTVFTLLLRAASAGDTEGRGS